MRYIRFVNNNSLAKCIMSVTGLTNIFLINDAFRVRQ